MLLGTVFSGARLEKADFGNADPDLQVLGKQSSAPALLAGRTKTLIKSNLLPAPRPASGGCPRSHGRRTCAVTQTKEQANGNLSGQVAAEPRRRLQRQRVARPVL